MTTGCKYNQCYSSTFSTHTAKLILYTYRYLLAMEMIASLLFPKTATI